MIFIKQLVYIIDGQEEVFDQFENIAIPIIAKYNGKLLLRVRPGNDAYIQSSIESPYEIHLVEFKTEDDLANFIQDEERNKFLNLKNQSIRSAVFIKGTKL